ncbi:MATE family efflux transporter [Bacteroides thetaiotaomicron]|nr:oligosaccharide flippase family protein [Bacteroides thetaiotaomicron]
MMISLYTSRIALEALGITDFGILNLVGGIVTLLSFLNASMVSTIQRFLTYELGRGDLDRLKLIFKTSLAVQFVLAILVIIIAETVGLWFLHTKVVIPYERFEAALWVYHFSILTCIISIISAPYSALIISYERMSAFAYISILEVLFKLFIAFGILYIAFDKLKIYIVLSCLVQLIIRIVYGIYCKRFETVKGKLCWNSNIFKEIIHFTSWNTLGSIAYVVLTQGINVVLNLFFGPVVNAARAIAMQVQSAITQFYMSFQTAVNPQITKSFAKNDFGYVNNLIIKSAMFSLFLLYFIALPIYLQTDVILKIWLKTVPVFTTDYYSIFYR